ncbi:MAG: hypothetical protein ACOC95_09900 [Planctomycetota bacterium]
MTESGDQASRLDEFPVWMPVRLLRELRRDLAEISRDKSLPSAEISLAVASMAAGGFFTALQGGVGLQSRAWWLFYGVLPALAASGTVSYVLLREFATSRPASRAAELLRLLPDPRVSAHEDLALMCGQWTLHSTTATSGKGSRGCVNLIVTQGQIQAAGQLYGEAEQPIAEVKTHICHYESKTKQFSMLYQVAAMNDNGSLDIAMCAFSGIVFRDDEKMTIRGTWYHLEGASGEGRRWGNATLGRDYHNQRCLVS